MFEVKNVAMVTEDGKRKVKVCNGIRSQMYDKIVEILNAEGFAAEKAANGDIAFPVVVDEVTGDTYFIRLAVSLSNKALDSKPAAKAKAKEKTEEVEVPNLFE